MERKQSASPFFGALLCFCLLTQLHSSGQTISLGIETGYNRNHVSTNSSPYFFTTYKSMGGANVAVPVQLKLNSWFGVQVAPTFIQKNYKLERSDYYKGQYQEFHNNYFQLPVMAQFSYGIRQWEGFVSLGTYTAYWSSGSTKGRQPSMWNTGDASAQYQYTIFAANGPQEYNEPYHFDDRKDNRWEFGLLAGIGAQYAFPHCSKIYIEGRLYYALTDQQKNYMINQVPRYNTTTSISVGYLYTLPCRRMF
ncbi:MAG TPA: porin family protein [Chitinophaga sp.]|uniref:porin family protein n=1 Tax=Chitinophaga sp. TaxID=1869181 RepID=UPI002CDF4445|nr:porin family protein [Chitinophaga sp.]HVI45135.1 porin family protein [Chitinophaga sp.]